MLKRAIGVVACVATLCLAAPVYAQGRVPDPDPRLVRYVHLMAEKRFGEGFELVVSAAGAGEQWAKVEMSKLTEVVVDPKRVQTRGPEYDEAMALLIARLQRAAEEGNAEAQYTLGMKALLVEPTDQALAMALLTKAAKQNQPNAVQVLKVLAAFGSEGVVGK